VWRKRAQPDGAPEGCLDNVRDGLLRGWAWEAANPVRAVAVDIVIDGQYALTVVADQFREDLKAAGKREGACAFETELPDSVYDYKPHRIEAFFYGTYLPLGGSPIDAVLDRPLARPANAAGRTAPRPVAPAARRAPPTRVLTAEDHERFRQGQQGDAGFSGVSVVLPTHNRAEALEATLREWSGVRAPCEIEFVVVNDGSSDDTAARLQRLADELPNLRWTSVPQGGPALARNAGITLARHDLILLIGDDIRPESSAAIEHHLHAHRVFPSPSVAVLGKIVWPNTDSDHVNFVMTHIQGPGEEQFGYFHTVPYSWLDWRFFYTSNVSFKKSVVTDWNREGFSGAFPLASFEDAELAYRLTKRPSGFEILYQPAACVRHHHPYSARQFLRRQVNCGLMAKVFEQLHPDVAAMIGVDGLKKALAEPAGAAPAPVEDYLSMIEGLKSWACVMDQQDRLGSRNWHGDLLAAVFSASYLQGRLMAHDDPAANYAAGYRYILEDTQERLSTAASYEALGRILELALV